MKKKAIHMKFLNHSIGFCLLLTLLCYSCASDYLDTAPTNQVSPADLFKDEAYAAYAVSGLEKLMKTTYPTNKLDGVSFNGEGSVKLMYAEYQGADMYCPRNNFYTIFNGASHAIPTSSYTEYMWHYYYKLISNANSILYYVNPESSPKFKYIYAQALTYRAYSYLQLLQFYSPRWCDSQGGSADGVPLRLSISSTGDCPLSSMLACYEQIYRDLDNAIASYESATASVAMSEADLTQAETALSYTTVSSPLSGYISERSVDIGTLVGPHGKSLLATVVKSDTVRVDFSMTGLDYLKSKARNVNLGQKDSTRKWDPYITITLADNTQYPLRGLVDFADPQVDPETGTFSVRAEMANPDRILLPGQFTKVRLLLDVREDATVVPTKSVVIEKGGAYIFVIRPDSIAERRLIELGPEVNNRVIVERGVVPGEKIVVEGFHKLTHGDKVDPVPVPEKSSATETEASEK